MPRKAPTPQLVIAAAIAFFVVAGIAVDRSSHEGAGASSSAGARAAAARVERIARRVETIRELRFKTVPKPEIEEPKQVRAAQLREYDRLIEPEKARASVRVLELLGLLEPGTDLREITGDVAGDQVAGYYNERRKRLVIVAGALAANTVASEITLAHELDHALDDQAIGLREMASPGADDAVSAYGALVEGTATSVMTDYARRYIDPGAALGSVFTAGGSASSGMEKIPPYVESSILFSYLVGQKFVNRLREIAHGWKLVNYALRTRPPRSTEQVIHPGKYFADERPVAIDLRGVAGAVPAGWRRLAHGTIGEFDTDQLLKLGVSDALAGDAAAGWGGGAYGFWAPPGSGKCASPCRRQSALVIAWAWDSELDATHFDEALRAYLEKGLDGRAAGSDVWAVGDGFAAIARRPPLRSALALAPSADLARRLASGALGR